MLIATVSRACDTQCTSVVATGYHGGWVNSVYLGSSMSSTGHFMASPNFPQKRFRKSGTNHFSETFWSALNTDERLHSVLQNGCCNNCITIKHSTTIYFVKDILGDDDEIMVLPELTDGNSAWLPETVNDVTSVSIEDNLSEHATICYDLRLSPGRQLKQDKNARTESVCVISQRNTLSLLQIREFWMRISCQIVRSGFVVQTFETESVRSTHQTALDHIKRIW